MFCYQALSEALRTSEAFNLQLKADLTKREKAAEEAGRREGSMAKTAEELQDKLKRVTEAAVGMERRCAELRAQTEHAKERLSEAKEALRELQADHTLLQRQFDDLQAQAQTAQEALKRSKAKKEAYKSKSEDAEAQAHAFRTQIEEVRENEARRAVEQAQKMEELEIRLEEAMGDSPSQRKSPKSSKAAVGRRTTKAPTATRVWKGP